MQALFEEFAFFERCDRYDPAAVDILLLERGRKGVRDRGEAEAVVQAAMSGASVILDDLWGRQLAERYELDYHGTLWVLEQFYKMQLIPPEQLREALQEMIHHGIRLPQDAVHSLLTRAGQEPLHLDS